MQSCMLTFSYHSDSKMGHVINYLLTGCSCRTWKYKALVFQILKYEVMHETEIWHMEECCLAHLSNLELTDKANRTQ